MTKNKGPAKAGPSSVERLVEIEFQLAQLKKERKEIVGDLWYEQQHEAFKRNLPADATGNGVGRKDRRGNRRSDEPNNPKVEEPV